MSQITRTEAVDALWRQGLLSWKLDSCQKQLYSLFKKSKETSVVWNCTRRLGKSYGLLVLCFEQAISRPNSEIKYACPTALQAQKIIRETQRYLLVDCPKDIKPEYVKSEKCFYFKNGSVIQIEGTDEGNAEKLRGTSAHLAVIDEAGSMDDLMYLIEDVLLPMTLTTKGRIIVASTPSRKKNHPFNVKIIPDAQKRDAYIKKTIYDLLKDIENDPPHLKNRITLEDVERLKKEYGEDSITWRVEYQCEIEIDLQSTVIPEFNEKREPNIVKHWPRPSCYDAYTSMDVGMVDFTGVLFAYWDFKNAKLVIEDEYLINGQEMTTQRLAADIKIKENTLWVDPVSNEHKPIYLRVSDDDLITLNDLNRLHGLLFIPTRKDDKEAAVNEVRIKMAAEQIIINPKCKNLIFQLKTATWAKNRKTFTRTEEAGHYDLVDALIYLVRNVQYHKNPYGTNPHNFSYDVFSRKGQNVETNNAAETFKKIFKINK